jgi:hypothetical protein
MIWERKTAQRGLASAMALALAACSVEPPTPPIGDTGPYRTVARVDVLSGPTVTRVGDTVVYTAAAYDNASNELPVTFTWHALPSTVLRLNSSTGAGRALAPGQGSVWASVGSAQSPPRRVTVNPSVP